MPSNWYELLNQHELSHKLKCCQTAMTYQKIYVPMYAIYQKRGYMHHMQPEDCYYDVPWWYPSSLHLISTQHICFIPHIAFALGTQFHVIRPLMIYYQITWSQRSRSQDPSWPAESLAIYKLIKYMCVFTWQETNVVNIRSRTMHTTYFNCIETKW